jgi:N-acetylmuramoyl-L-alanine amidase
MSKLLLSLFAIVFLACLSQLSNAQETPFIKLVNPGRSSNNVSSATQFLIGSTCKTCTLTVNGEQVKVHSSGGFAYELNLVAGDASFELLAQSAGNKQVSRKVAFTFTSPLPAEPVKILDIENIQTIPEGDLVLMPGDKIQFKVKALPGSNLLTYKNTPLYEMPAELVGGMKGIYQGEYTVQPADNFSSLKMPVTITGTDGKQITKETKYRFSVFSSLSSDVALTKGRLAYLEYGLGEDRLGGAKIGYLDSLVQLKIVGKVGDEYKVQLAKNRVAYIPADQVSLMPKGTFAPSSLTGSWSVNGDNKYDYVNISLTTRLPYQSYQELNPSKIIVDIFGATGNTNWITQLQSMKEIESVDYEQVADDIFRVKLQLKHRQHWGHAIYYKGNTLVIRVKQQPKKLSLSNLTVAIDAGHGGSNTGAGGPTGSSEKQLALEVSLKLQQLLQAAGAKVLMTRTTDKFVENRERILMYRDNEPDLLVSIHLNSAGNPIRPTGTSTHYRYIGNKLISDLVNSRMQELGLKQYGVIGSFNFMLNSPTEYPNVLVETLFLSNPADEALMLQAAFQQQMAQKILNGIKDFLDAVEK